MLDLDSPEWGALAHAYGTAHDIPALLRDLCHFPPEGMQDDGTWHMLWSSLCHQSDIYPASFAAVPPLLQMAAAWPQGITTSFLLLPTCIEISRQTGRFPPVPEALAAPYFDAIRSLPLIVAACGEREWNDGFARTASAALCAAKGHGALADAILELSGDVLGSFNEWLAGEWDRSHPPVPGPPPPPPFIQPPSSTYTA
jgi:hypothetical protein